MRSLFSSFPRSKAEAIITAKRLMSSSALQSAFWVVVGTGGSQVIRLLGNLVLTRLLFPEVFGIIALVYAVLVGVAQISDVGLREGVVNSDRIDDPQFMRTAWTLQVLRTGLIAILCSAIAYPIAHAYDEPLLAPVLICIAFSTFIGGFKSIALLAYDKRLDIKKQMLVDLALQVAGLTVVITWAWLWPTVWAMVAGQIFASVMEVSLSYILFKGHHSKLAWDRSSVSQLFGFGKWIFVSSSISYVTNQGDRLIMGLFLTMGELGKYSVAATWSAIVALLSISFSTRVLHPYFKQAIDHHADFNRIHKVRTLLNIAYMWVCIGLAIFGDWLIIFLYDDRYADAGWMVQILAMGQVARSFTGTLMPFMLAQGDSFSQMKFSASSAIILVSFILLGGFLAGAPGVIIAYSMSGIFAHPVMIVFAKKHGYNCALTDLGLVAFACVFCVLVWWVIDAPLLDVLVDLFNKFNLRP